MVSKRAAPPDRLRRPGEDGQSAPGQARQRRAIIAGVLLLALLGVLVVLLDWREVQRVAAEASWQWASLTLVFTATSYIFLSYSYAIINRAFGIRLGRRDLLTVGFVSSAMIAAVGGLAGHSLRCCSWCGGARRRATSWRRLCSTLSGEPGFFRVNPRWPGLPAPDPTSIPQRCGGSGRGDRAAGSRLCADGGGVLLGTGT